MVEVAAEAEDEVEEGHPLGPLTREEDPVDEAGGREAAPGGSTPIRRPIRSTDKDSSINMECRFIRTTKDL